MFVESVSSFVPITSFTVIRTNFAFVKKKKAEKTVKKRIINIFNSDIIFIFQKESFLKLNFGV
jgi:hypothetical protein